MDVADAWSNLADWDDRETLESQPADPVWDPAGNDITDELDNESGNWMLVALMDLEREEGSDSQ